MKRALFLSSIFLGSLCLASSSYGQDDVKFVQVETIQDADQSLLRKFEKALKEGKMDDVLVHMNGLMSRSRGNSANHLVGLDGSDEKSPTRFRGFRDYVLARLLTLPKEVRDKIARGHNAAVRGILKRSKGKGELSEDTLREIVENYPLASEAQSAAEKLAELCFERDDVVAALHYDAFIDRFHLFGSLSWSSRARRALIAARTGQFQKARSILAKFKAKAEKTARNDILSFLEQTTKAVEYTIQQKKSKKPKLPKIPSKLVLRNPRLNDSKIAFWETKRGTTNNRRAMIWRNGRRVKPLQDVLLDEPPRFHPYSRGDFVYVSNGRRIFAHSALTGRRKAILPFHFGETIEDPPPPGMETQVVSFGSLLLSNLYIPRSSPSLSRNRGLYGHGFGNNYGSLFLFDADRGHRAVFWEGDQGPGLKDSGAIQQPEDDNSQSSRSLASLLRNGHILGRPAICGQRLYAAMLVSDGEPEIWIAAFDRGDRKGEDLGVGLYPIWRTFIGTVNANDEKAIPAVFPSVVVSKSQVFVDSGTATLACVSATNGRMQWISQTTKAKKKKLNNNPFGRFNAEVTEQNPPSLEPLRFVERAGKSDLVLVAPPGRNEVKAFDTVTGKRIWSSGSLKVKANRFLVTREGVVILYGKRYLIALDGRNGKLASDPNEDGRFEILPQGDDVTFRGDIDAKRFVLPTGAGTARVIDYKVELRGKYKFFEVKFKMRKTLKLVGCKDDGHLVFTSHGLAYATKDRLLIYGADPKGK